MEILANIDVYERYCTEHPEYENNRAVHAIANIGRVYDERLKKMILHRRKPRMKDILRNIANLIKVKTIVTLVVLAVFATLALRGDISPDNVMVIVTTVIAFYFGTQHEKMQEKGSESILHERLEE